MSASRWLALSFLILAGCKAKPSTPLEEAALRAKQEPLVARGDTNGLASLAYSQCRWLSSESKQTCYENYFVALSDSGRVRLALGALTALSEKDKKVQSDGHVYTHIIGIRAWAPGRDVGKVFDSCTGLFQSGCYHGVIQAYFTSDGSVDSTEVSWFCDLMETTRTNRWLRFQCVHGIGHGLEMAWNWDLPRSLKGCDWLPSTWDRESCYGGVFMENAVASMPGGHHAPKRVLAEGSGGREGGTTDSSAGEHSEHSEHSGHGGDPAPGAITFKMRDSADALYPCSIVDPKYWQSCYMLQGGMIVGRFNQDYERAALACDSSPQEVRHFCYLSMGTMASGITIQDVKRTIRLCSVGDRGYRPWCFVGAVKNFIDVTAKASDGFEFCQEAPAGNDKRQCWVAIGEQIAVLYADPAPREAACAKAPEGQEECRYGAGLLATPPKGLPILPGQPTSG
jgi:hypothetical protein